MIADLNNYVNFPLGGPYLYWKAPAFENVLTQRVHPHCVSSPPFQAVTCHDFLRRNDSSNLFCDTDELAAERVIMLCGALPPHDVGALQ